MNILVVDPGGTTGIATWTGWADGASGTHEAWAEPFDGAQATAHRIIADGITRSGGMESCPVDLVVFESIVITGQTLKKSRDVQGAIEFVGVGRYLSRCYGVEFITQTPADAMGFSTKAKLDAMGWDMPGPGDHAKAASKHLLLALVNRRQIDLKSLARSIDIV